MFSSFKVTAPEQRGVTLTNVFLSERVRVSPAALLLSRLSWDSDTEEEKRQKKKKHKTDSVYSESSYSNSSEGNVNRFKKQNANLFS